MLIARHNAVEHGTPQKLREHLKAIYTKNDPATYELLRVPDFFEDVAVMVKSRTIPFKMIRRSWGMPIVLLWRHWKLAVMSIREMQQQPTAYENWERLAARLERKMKLERPTPRLVSAASESEAAPSQGTDLPDGQTPTS
jgi:hypothetical protein